MVWKTWKNVKITTFSCSPFKKKTVPVNLTQQKKAKKENKPCKKGEITSNSSSYSTTLI